MSLTRAPADVVLRRRVLKTLARTARFRVRFPFWPSSVDLLRDPGRGRPSRRTICRDLALLAEHGLVVRINARQWAVTSAGYAVLGDEVKRPTTPERRWRDTRWRDRLRKATFEVYERVEELPVEEV